MGFCPWSLNLNILWFCADLRLSTTQLHFLLLRPTFFLESPSCSWRYPVELGGTHFLWGVIAETLKWLAIGTHLLVPTGLFVWVVIDVAIVLTYVFMWIEPFVHFWFWKLLLKCFIVFQYATSDKRNRRISFRGLLNFGKVEFSSETHGFDTRAIPQPTISDENHVVLLQVVAFARYESCKFLPTFQTDQDTLAVTRVRLARFPDSRFDDNSFCYTFTLPRKKGLLVSDRVN